MLALGGLTAPAASAAPDFTWAPDPPVACELVTFAPSVDTEGAMWDYENNDTFVSDLTHAFQTEGTHPVEMTSTNGSPVTHDVVVSNAPPVAAFEYSPAQPDPGEWIVFDSTATDCDDSVDSVEWDFHDGTTSTDPNPVHKFDTAGPHDVTLTVTDEDLATDSETRVVEVGAVPTAAFHRDPPASALLETGQVVTFTSDSTPSPGGSISSLKWDFDGDGFDDGSGASVSHSFTAPGMYVVRLEVEQTNGRRAVAESVFRVNGPPVPGFVWSPASPLAGGQVELYSTSADAEGPVASEAWELDGDGDFNDAVGPAIVQTFAAGVHQVSLRVTDGDGVSRTITRTIAVTAPAAPPTFMNPFPTVRLAGTILPRGTRVRVLDIRSPRGARVTVRCSGVGCPFRSQRRIAETGRVRLSNFERVLRAGTRIQVYVRAPRVIGRFVGFRIRAGKGPIRTERCLLPGVSDPAPCP